MATARGGSVASELSIVLLKEIEKELEDVEVREQQQQDGARRRLMTHSGYGSIPPSSREATRGNDDDDQSPLLADQSLADDVLIAEGEVKKQSRKFTTNQKLVLAAFCATNFCNFLVYSLIAPFFPNEVIKKGGTATMAGLIFSSYELVMFVMGPIYGRYMSTIGARFLLITGPFIVSVCSILMGFLDRSPPGTTFIVLAFAVRMIEGLGAVAYFTTSIAIRSILFPDDIAFTFGMIQTFTSLGLTLGPVTGGALYTLGGFSLPFWVLGGVYFVLAVCLWLVLPDVNESKSERSKTRQSPFALLANLEVGVHLIAYTSVAFAITFYESIISLHVTPLVNNAFEVGLVVLCAGAAEAIVAPIVGLYLDRGVSTLYVSLTGFGGAAIGLLLMGPSPLLPFLQTNLWLIVIGTFIYGVGLSGFFAAPFKAATEAALRNGFPANQATFGVLGSLFTSSFTAGALIGPAVGGALQDAIGFRWAATIAAFVEIALACLLIFGTRRGKRTTRQDEEGGATALREA